MLNHDLRVSSSTLSFDPVIIINRAKLMGPGFAYGACLPLQPCERRGFTERKQGGREAETGEIE